MARIQQLNPIHVDLTQSTRDLDNLRESFRAGELQQVGKQQARATLIRDTHGVAHFCTCTAGQHQRHHAHDEKVFQFLDALLPDAESMRFVESRSPCVADADIGMPSLRVLKAPVDGNLAYHTIKAASPMVTLVDPALLRILYRSLRDDALASDPGCAQRQRAARRAGLAMAATR